ncbi:TniB family NTP-binding protein [Pseudomonas sp. NPDC098747]|uniref:TniB family NTP-binding protein n=1 Tax=Pseudomonas sp. NPDC098747 TaxID=3364487 RepID=UPI00383BF29A
MNLMNEEKIKHFRSFTVAHPEYREALDTIHRSMEATRLRGEPSCVILLGDPGTGKTRICDDILTELGPPTKKHTADGVCIINPVIYCRVPNNATIKTLVTRLLNCFETYTKYQSVDALEFRLFNILHTCQTVMIILDEWQHLLRSGTGHALQSAADWVKVLTDIYSGEVMLVGPPACERMIDQHQALADRFPYRARLSPFSLASPEHYSNYLKLIRAFAIDIKESMGFIEIPPLTDEKVLLGVYAATGGNMRALRVLLNASLTNALNRNDSNLLISDFSMAACQVKLATRLTPQNPFDKTCSELKKIIFTSSKKCTN